MVFTAMNRPTSNTSKTDKYIPVLLALAGAILFLPFLGRVHLFDWDEINFAECAREMIMAKQYFLVTINYLPFWEKPPLFIWMQALCMKLFGIGDYAARLPNAICGIVTLIVLYKIGRTLKDKRFGLLWVLAYVGSVLPHFYFKSGIIDPWFNFFIFTGIYFSARFRMQKKNLLEGKPVRLIVLSALCIGLGVMTKGPVALLVFVLSVIVYWLFAKRKAIASFGQISLFGLIFLAVGGAWFLAAAFTGHLNTLIEFVQYQIRLLNTQDAGHGGPFYFHVPILLFGCFPASIFAIRGMIMKKDGDEKFNEMRLWMGILFWVVLILFSIVRTKIIHYSSLCYYPLTFFAAVAAYNIFYENQPWKKWMSWGLAISGGLLGIALVGLPIVAMHKQAIIDSGIIKDAFAEANFQANVNWTYWDCTIGVLLLLGIIICIVLASKKKLKWGVITIFLATLITTNATLIFSAPKIEQYTQQAAIDFYQGLSGKDVYVNTLGFKSFAQYFYSDIKPWKDVHSTDDNWLLTGPIDKPAYFVSKINKVQKYEKQYHQLKELYRKNGFVFLERVNNIH